MTRPSHLLAMGGLSVALAGCTTFGTNVKGDFACRAPSGTCRPMTAIDAAAVEALDGAKPAAPATVQAAALPMHSVSSGVPVRVAERTLAILLPAYVDEAGILHDSATVHAVVEPGGWAATTAGPEPISALSRSSAPSSLREAIAGASAPAIEGLESLPRAPQSFDATLPDTGSFAVMPSAAAIGAARAGHRIGQDAGASASRVPSGGSSLPSGKVMLPPGDPAAANTRVKALVLPVLTKPAASGASSSDGDPGDPFGIAKEGVSPR